MKKSRKMDPQNVISDRIRAIYEDLRKKGIIGNQKVFYEAIDLDPSRMSMFLAHKIHMPKSKYRDISEVYGVNLNYILYGEDPVYKNQEENVNFVKQNVNSSVNNAKLIGEIFPGEEETQFRDLGDGKLLMLVPKVDVYTMAGFLENVQDSDFIAELPKEEIVVDKYHRGRYLAFEVVGESMTDGTDQSIPHGSTVIGREVQIDLWKLSRIHMHRWSDYIIVHKDGIIVKQIINHDVEKGIITIHSLNSDKKLFPDEEIRVDDIKELYNVIEVRIKRRR